MSEIPAFNVMDDCREALQALDTRPIWEWAHENVDLPPCYAVTGPFDSSRVPFIHGPLTALRDPTIRVVVAQCGLQVLKTLLGEIWLLHTISENAGPTQWLQPTDDEAKEHAEERFNKLRENCPSVHRFYSENRFEKKTVAIIFKHMWLRMEGAENLGNLQRKSVKNQMCSEVWQWKKGYLSEAEGRLTQFTFNSKRYIESQAGIADDDMDMAYKSGDQNVWGFECLSCHKWQPYRWTWFRQDGTRAAMRWEDSERTRRPNGDWKLAEVESTIRYECVHCGFPHTDEPRIRRLMNQAGSYQAQRPEAPHEVKSFTWNQLAMENLSWFKQFLKWDTAREQFKRGNEIPQREFMQKVLGEPYDPSKGASAYKPEKIVILDAPWEKEYFRAATFDVQEDHFWGMVAAWAKDGEIRILWCGLLRLWADIEDKCKEFHVSNRSVGLDARYRTREVYLQCVNHGDYTIENGEKVYWCWKAFMGEDRKNYPYRIKTPSGEPRTIAIDLAYSWPPHQGDPMSGKSDAGQYYCPLVYWSNPTIKDIAAKIRDGRAQKMSVPEHGSEELMKHLLSERRIKVWDKYGQDSWKYENIGKRPNHLWDCFCMQVLFACIAGVIGEQTTNVKSE